MNKTTRFRVGVTVESRLTAEQKHRLNQQWIEKDISKFMESYEI